MKLAYRACDRSGNQIADTMEASDASSAAEALRQKKLYVIDISEVTDSSQEGQSRGRSSRHNLKDLAVFTRELSVLVCSGTPLVEALGALQQQAKTGLWRDTLARVRQRVEEGTAMSDAMEAHPERFDSAYCSLVAAGESGGNLGEMLERLADLKRKQLLLRNSIVGAMVYPCLLLSVALVVSTVMLTLVVPRFSDLFKSLDVPLPASTKALVVVSHLVRSYWWAVLLVAAGSALGLKSWLASPSGRYARDTFILRIPRLGSIVKSFAVARMTRLLGVLLDSHVNILKALNLTKQSANNVHYQALIAKAEDLVSRGEPISSAFCDTDLVSPTVSEAIRNGERTGKLSLLLLYVADFLDDENEIIMRSLASIIEPVILVVLGLLVGAVAISLFTPLFDLGSMAQGGGT